MERTVTKSHILMALLSCLLTIPVYGQSYTYNFSAPTFTANETLPILNRTPNIGGNDFAVSFTSSPNANGFNISSFLTAPLSGLSLNSTGSTDTLTLTFTRPVLSLSFGAATGAIANQANGRINLNWGTGNQDFTTTTLLPNNFQVGSPSLTFPSAISSLDISAFNGANTQVRFFMDNLVVTAAVPEPTTMIMLGGVAVGAFIAGRKYIYRQRVLQHSEVETACD